MTTLQATPATEQLVMELGLDLDVVLLILRKTGKNCDTDLKKIS